MESDGFLLVYGRKIYILYENLMNAGLQNISWDTKDRASGIYFAKLQAENYMTTQKLTIVK